LQHQIADVTEGGQVYVYHIPQGHFEFVSADEALALCLSGQASLQGYEDPGGSLPAQRGRKKGRPESVRVPTVHHSCLSSSRLGNRRTSGHREE
jgi:hypothetical protein